MQQLSYILEKRGIIWYNYLSKRTELKYEL